MKIFCDFKFPSSFGVPVNGASFELKSCLQDDVVVPGLLLFHR